MPVLSYGFGVVEWTASEISHFDVKVHRALFECNSHHPHSSIEHVCLPWSMGGWLWYGQH